MRPLQLTPGRIAALRSLEVGRIYPFDAVRGNVRVPMFSMDLLEAVRGRLFIMRLTVRGAEAKAHLPPEERRTRFRCTVCGKLGAGRMPREGKVKGDGSARFPRRHKGPSGRLCPGVHIEAEWVDE